MNEPQSQLARLTATPSTSDAQVKAMGARAWWESEVLVVRLATVSDPMVRRLIKAVAAYCFGSDRG